MAQYIIYVHISYGKINVKINIFTFILPYEIWIILTILSNVESKVEHLNYSDKISTVNWDVIYSHLKFAADMSPVILQGSIDYNDVDVFLIS